MRVKFWFCVYTCGHIKTFEFRAGYKSWISSESACAECGDMARLRKRKKHKS